MVPLVIGTFVCYIAATAFDDFFDLDTVRILDPEMAAEVAAMPLPQQLGALATLCEGAVSPGVLPAGRRGHPAAAAHPWGGVQLLSAHAGRTRSAGCRHGDCDLVVDRAWLLALSTQPWADTGCGGVLGYWHEYLTFVISVQGVATGLGTLMWLLVARAPTTACRGGQPMAEAVAAPAQRPRGVRGGLPDAVRVLLQRAFVSECSRRRPGGQTAWRIAVIVVDATVLGSVGLMKRVVTAADGDAPRLWGWWCTGVVILLAIDVLRLIPWSRFESTC